MSEEDIDGRHGDGRDGAGDGVLSTVRNSRSSWMQTLGMMPATCASSFKPWGVRTRRLHPHSTDGT